MTAIQLKEKPADLIGKYVALRDQRKAADEQFAQWRKENYDLAMDDIEKKLLDMLNQMGTDSVRTRQGTAYKKLSTSVTTADAAEFRRHVIGGEFWDLINFVPNKTAVNELVAAGEPLPPGLNRTGFYNVHINRPKEKEEKA